MSVSIIQQKISATDDFDETLPVGTPVFEKDIKRFPAAAAGGLFDFGLSQPHEVVAVELKLGGQSAWSIKKRDSDGEDFLLWSGTTETGFVKLSSERVLLTEDELILVSTTGATGALTCRVAVEALK